MEKELAYSKEGGFVVKPIDALPAKCEEGEVIIRPKSIGICGSDLNFIETMPKGTEIYLGHEWVGVVELSNPKSSFRKGDVVTSGALIGCGKCEFCLSNRGNLCKQAKAIGSKDKGMIRTWASMPEHAIIKLASSLDPGALTLLEVAAVGDESVRQLQALTNQKGKLLIVGMGPVGIFTALRAMKEGYDVDAIEIEAFRIKAASSLKIPVRSLGEFLLDRKSHQQYQLIIDCSGDNGGKPGIWKYLHTLSTINTKLVVVGKYSQEIKIDPILAGATNLLIKWTRGLPKDSFQKTILDWSNEIDAISKVVITHRFPMEKMQNGIDLALKKSEAMKIIIDV